MYLSINILLRNFEKLLYAKFQNRCTTVLKEIFFVLLFVPFGPMVWGKFWFTFSFWTLSAEIFVREDWFVWNKKKLHQYLFYLYSHMQDFSRFFLSVFCDNGFRNHSYLNIAHRNIFTLYSEHGRFCKQYMRFTVRKQFYFLHITLQNSTSPMIFLYAIFKNYCKRVLERTFVGFNCKKRSGPHGYWILHR